MFYETNTNILTFVSPFLFNVYKLTRLYVCGKIKTIKAGSLYALHYVLSFHRIITESKEQRVSLRSYSQIQTLNNQNSPKAKARILEFEFVFIMLSYQSGLFRNSFRYGYVGDVLKCPRDQPSSNKEPFPVRESCSDSEISNNNTTNGGSSS